MELKEYLRKELKASTTKRYQKDINFFLSSEPRASRFTYQEIVRYVGRLRTQYDNPKTINRILAAIKKYYDYLLYTGQREDHPCRSLKLRDVKRNDFLVQDLFSEKDLELLLTAPPDRYRSYYTDKTRNKLILSLLIYQGLMRGEIARIRTEDINLEQGEIYIPGHAKLNPRTLPLRAKQIHLIYQYLEKRKPIQEQLFIGQQGEPLSGDAIRRLVSRYKYLFEDKPLSCSTIRMSVCRNLLNSGKDLRAVQVYMGHKYPSSTERYKTSSTEALKQAIKKYHPLG